MSEERFTYDKPLVAFSKGGINDNVTGETYEFTMDTVLDLLNEQQAAIEQLKERNVHNFAKKIQLMKEIRELKEEEKFYAKEIVRLNKNIEELNKTIEEALKFKSLGGDY